MQPPALLIPMENSEENQQQDDPQPQTQQIVTVSATQPKIVTVTAAQPVAQVSQEDSSQQQVMQ